MAYFSSYSSVPRIYRHWVDERSSDKEFSDWLEDNLCSDWIKCNPFDDGKKADEWAALKDEGKFEQMRELIHQEFFELRGTYSDSMIKYATEIGCEQRMDNFAWITKLCDSISAPESEEKDCSVPSSCGSMSFKRLD